jgi:hypothetical protein
LDCRKRAVLSHAFNRRDLLAFTAGGEHRAREHRRAVNQNCTSSAGGIIAAAFRAGELQVLAESVEQNPIGLERKLMRAIIDPELNNFLLHQTLSCKNQKKPLTAKVAKPAQRTPRRSSVDAEFEELFLHEPALSIQHSAFSQQRDVR